MMFHKCFCMKIFCQMIFNNLEHKEITDLKEIKYKALPIWRK